MERTNSFITMDLDFCLNKAKIDLKPTKQIETNGIFWRIDPKMKNHPILDLRIHPGKAQNLPQICLTPISPRK